MIKSAFDLCDLRVTHEKVDEFLLSICGEEVIMNRHEMLTLCEKPD